MKAKEFVQKWDAKLDPVIKYNEDVLKTFNLPQDMISELSQFGLPRQAAPGLAFYAYSSIVDMPEVTKKNGECFYVGETAEGDYICFHLIKKVFVIISHEEDESLTIFNTSLFMIYASLQCYAEFVRNIRKHYGPKAYIKRNIPIELVDKLETDLKEIDEFAVEEKTFWNMQLRQLREDIADSADRE